MTSDSPKTYSPFNRDIVRKAREAYLFLVTTRVQHLSTARLEQVDEISFLAFDRTHTTYVVFKSRGSYDVSWVLIAVAGHFRLSPPSWTDWQTWPRSHAGVKPMQDRMNLGYLKLLYREFQKYEVMALSVVSGQPKRHANPSYKATKQIERTFLIIISDYCCERLQGVGPARVELTTSRMTAGCSTN